jgi:DNA-binding CsgD family transcriptional regulator
MRPLTNHTIHITVIDVAHMLENLSSREREIFDLLIEGLSQKEIAHKLNISHSTVDFHRTNLYRKLDVHNIKELFAKYSTNGKTAPSEPEAAFPVSGTKKYKKSRLSLPAGVAVGIIMLALSVSLIWIFVIKPSAYFRPKGVIIPAHNLGFFPWTDSNDRIGESTAEVFISSEEIDGVEIYSVLNIKTNLVKIENSDIIYATAITQKHDVIQRLRQANGIRFKARGDGKVWSVRFDTIESTAERNYARYVYSFGTVRDQVMVVDVPYSELTLPEWYEQYSFDFNKETIKFIEIYADPYVQGFGSSSLQIFDFEIY